MTKKAKGKVFYVDDEPELLEFLKFVLEKYGYEVICRDRWTDSCIEEIKECNMVILDIMFPSGHPTGYEICRQIRNIEELKNIPIYMFSAKAFNEDKEGNKRHP